MIPSLERAVGASNVHEMRAITGAEDFSYFQEQVPGLYFFLGGMDPAINPSEAPSHHTPDFLVQDEGMILWCKSIDSISYRLFKPMKFCLNI